MLRAGMPVNHALESAAEGTPWNLRAALLALARYTEEGHPLSDGMQDYGNIFHPVVPAIVQAGEKSELKPASSVRCAAQ
jgi:type II secretory pathway component PulF